MDYNMKATGITRPFDNLGRVVLPIEIRRLFNLKPRDAVEIYVDEEGIYLKPYHRQESCVFCNSAKDLVPHTKEKYICEGCWETIGSKISNK